MNVDLAALIQRWSMSPLDFVLEALFKIDRDVWQPWTPGTPRPPISPVGPELWQGRFLDDVGAAIEGGKRRFAVRAGHGVGKSTVEAWLIIWFVCFHRKLKCPVTANSQDQLRDVVWAEIARWHRELPPFIKQMVDITAERVVAKQDPEGAFAVARTARPEKPEALQGFHAETLSFFIEEASGIDDIIFETAGGALSSDNAWVFMFGNPTRSSGYFHRAFHVNRDSWRTYTVSCFESSRVSDTYAEEMIREYGEDSNVYRVRVLGEFPMSDDNAVIPLHLLESAVGRDVEPTVAGVVWGLDVARFGDDTTCLAKRCGNTILEPWLEWKKVDLMQTVGRVVTEYERTPIHKRPASINVDVIGMGGGVVDRLREMGLPVRGINVGEAPATDAKLYMRLRDELWFKTKDWFASLAVTMPNDEALIGELVAPTYKFESTGKLKVESKDDMKKRGVKSPNRADALCLTFAGGDHNLDLRQESSITNYDPLNFGIEEVERAIRQTHAGMDYTPF